MNKKPMKKYKIAVLDDYQNAALECAERGICLTQVAPICSVFGDG